VKTLILCDRESERYNDFNLRFMVQAAVQEMGNEVNVVVLNGDEINPCRGCFQCWIKTPGLCAVTSDCANTVSGQEIQSDVVVFISKINYGCYSYDVKSFLDRSIPNISPYFEIFQGEMHHKMRYQRFPYMITIGYGVFTSQEQQTFISLAERNALNMRPPKHFVFTMQNEDEASEVIQSLKDVFSREMCQ